MPINHSICFQVNSSRELLQTEKAKTLCQLRRIGKNAHCESLLYPAYDPSHLRLISIFVLVYVDKLLDTFVKSNAISS